MNEMSGTHLAPPKAAMLIESMRDFGYSLETALADVIDNSITAGASAIHIHADTSSSEPKTLTPESTCGARRENCPIAEP